MGPFLCILASKRNGTLYTGVTSDLTARVAQHKRGMAGGFTAQYGVKTLVYFELHETMENAVRRERQVKKWRRRWKLELIERQNPRWRDLYPDLF
ncbi:GIY-YIG nuclease family protein [Nisaea acidiphila]|uniref:GIY-YIG nuclease family protein n=1 Tax=Nisaea acidiphila TaxID=1862145 RepID=A0A9J7AX89_9PROT|nr:GIY-YIG nuclease family protein [Nisaea acidiphila]UUX50860.1 GIY-YIG nuclease family protein [Nisaea acidiphila]